MKYRERVCFLLSMSIALLPATLPAGEPEETLIFAPGGEIHLAAGEPGATIEVAVDGGVLGPVPEPFTAPGDGDHWLAVCNRDRAGNLSEVRWMRLRVDAQAPVVEIDFEPDPQRGPDGELWALPWTLIRAHARDELAGVARTALIVGDTSAEEASELVTLEVPLNGRYVITAWSEDRVGNRSAETRIVVSVADQPPRRPLDSPRDFETASPMEAP